MQGNQPRDPVCGLEVHPDDVDSWVEYGGTQYYFCCPECQQAFEENPEQYTGERQEAERTRCDSEGEQERHR